MSTIRQPIEDILTKLASLQVVTQDGEQASLYARVWNNQIDPEQTGELGYNFQKPAAFLEILNDQVYETIGEGVQGTDIIWRIHLAHQDMGQEGTLEQNLLVFDLRDNVVALLSRYKPTGCGPMIRISETQDYAHKNIYHYIIDFSCNFTDTAGAKVYTESTPPTTLEVDITTAQGGGQHGDEPQATPKHNFVIN